jgi:hypothetical protein
MTSRKIHVLEGSSRVFRISGTSSFSFLSVKIGASELEILETAGNFDFSAKKLTNVAAATANGDAVEFGQYTTALAAKVNNSEKGAANGVATLDGGGKVPVAQLPNSIMEYQGVYNATTNSPVLVDGTGNTGDVYRVTVAGTRDFGSGNIVLDVGDYVIYNGTTWEKSDTTDSVPSVNGQTGNVVLDSDDIGEGSTNLYFTVARAKAAAVADSITDGVTDVAPSQNAVFDALALKSDTGHTHVAADVTDFDAAALSAAVQSGAITNGVTKAPTHDAVFDALALKQDVGGGLRSFTNSSGATIAAAKAAYLKTDGTVAAAQADAAATATSLLLFSAASVADAASGQFYFAPGSVVPGFSGLTVGAEYFLSALTAGNIVTSAPSSAGQFYVSVGRALSATELLFNPQLPVEVI